MCNFLQKYRTSDRTMIGCFFIVRSVPLSNYLDVQRLEIIITSFHSYLSIKVVDKIDKVCYNGFIVLKTYLLRRVAGRGAPT